MEAVYLRQLGIYIVYSSEVTDKGTLAVKHGRAPLRGNVLHVSAG